MLSNGKGEIQGKWEPILNSIGITGSKANLFDDYIQSISEIDSLTASNFPSMMPMAMKVAAHTVGLDLVSVSPLPDPSKNENDRIKKEVIAENRDRKIDSLTDNKEYQEMKMEDHPDYKGTYGGYYIDFKYGATSV